MPDPCLRELDAADVILHGGDFVAARVLAELEELGPVEAVHGNMDEPALTEALPERRVVEVEETRIGMVHIAGPRAGREARLIAAFPTCAAVVYGHTHIPEVSQHEDVLVLNPGSPTERRRAATHAMIVLDVAGNRLEARLVELP